MTRLKPLTSEQRQFAEDNHALIESFIRFKRLDYNYYDILAFGYLRAVQKYFNRPELHQYRFITIAYAAMNSDLYNHYRKQYRRKRYAYTVSLDTAVYGDGENLRLSDIISSNDTAEDNIAYEQLLQEISAVLPAEYFNIVLLKSQGYSDREIAKRNNIPVYSVQEALSSARDLLKSKNYIYE